METFGIMCFELDANVSMLTHFAAAIAQLALNTHRQNVKPAKNILPRAPGEQFSLE